MSPLDTSSCETEPIRYPGAVQPHGALLVLDAESRTIEAASESCLALFGLLAGSLLGRRIGLIVGWDVEAALLAPQIDGLEPLVPLVLNGKTLYARSSTNEAGLIVVDLETANQERASIQRLIYNCRRDLARLRRLSDIPEITQNAVEMIRDITGFDRVMLYRFDEAWNGAVIAEARADDVAAYLGLNFPASDIPRQARELFQLSKVRLIPDVRYTPSGLIARREARSIDLGRSCLRSVSPIHIEYLTNMDVRSTMVGALVVEGSLWGLVSCQNTLEPRFFSPAERDTLGWMFEDIAALVEATQIRQRREREYGLALRRRRLVDAMGVHDFKSLMQHESRADLLEVVGADGFALLVDESIQTMGVTPDAARIRELQTRRRELETDPTFFASSALTRDLGVTECNDGVAGAIFVSLRDRPDITMIWFRNERYHSVRWAGDPEHAHFVDESGRISPRKSFALFLQNIRGQSLPWSQAELDSAGELGSLIEIEVQHRYKTELNILQTVLSRVNEAILVTEPNFEPGQSQKILWVSETFERLSGYTAEELTEMQAEIMFGPKTGAADLARMGEQFARREAVRVEVLRQTKDGKPFWVDMDILPVLDRTGQVAQLISIERDITARRQMEESLRKLSTAIEQSPASVVITDLDAKIEYVNPRFTEVTGYTAAEVIGKNPRIIQSQETPRETFQALWDNLTGGDIWSGELLNRRKNGDLYWEESHIAPVKNPDGIVTHYVAVNLDITERKNAEKALRESEAFAKTILDSIPEHICVLDPQGRIVSVNKAWCKFAQNNEAVWLAENVTAFSYRDICIASADQADGKDAIDAWAGIESILKKTSDHFVLDYPCDSPDAPRWFRMSVYPMIAPCEGAVVAHENITERKLMEISLDNERTQLRTLLETIPDLVWLKTPEGVYLTCNTAFEQFLGASAAEIVGKADRDFLDDEQAAIFRERDCAAIAAGTPCITDEIMTFANDGHRAFMATIRTPMLDHSGALVGVLGIARDITERMEAEARIKAINLQLADQGRKLEQRVIERTEQLRQLAVKTTLAEERERQAIAADLHDDLGQMLHVAKIKLGTLSKSIRDGFFSESLISDLNSILAEASGMVRSLTSQLSPPVLRELGLVPALGWLADEMGRIYSLDVSVEDDGASKPLTSAQSAILFRAVRELLINVSKHAQTDTAEVKVRAEDGRIVITVTDKGIGIADPRWTTSSPKGFGLNSLRERITYLKGAVTIESNPGHGTVVTLYMQFEAPPTLIAEGL
ncbi:PAS domain S-box protein [Magnetospirillum molischianum]|uniref:Putative two-component sensor histidine kinase, classical system putative bacteriophytochrome n=1 Tax=Magnetospirillum molischianum DSM 120 TaxID=1150626 RepID=H8FQ21_MAGML|nr:PAS domain S-box protein [Magnetospirillum molischianum]CCG40459.1 Putative two-component sensor histidine kinase, classical system; putative bacteriophytochrome [Magnetospirillum molischianum DSM 120]